MFSNAMADGMLRLDAIEQEIKDLKQEYHQYGEDGEITETYTLPRPVDEMKKEMREFVDKSKKELGEGIIIVFAVKDGKIGIAVGITTKLASKYDAVKLVKVGSEIIGGKGGGGRSDFAQAGGVDENKIDEAFNKIKSLI